MDSIKSCPSFPLDGIIIRVFATLLEEERKRKAWDMRSDRFPVTIRQPAIHPIATALPLRHNDGNLFARRLPAGGRAGGWVGGRFAISTAWDL